MGDVVAYQSIGSGAGIIKIKSGSVDFGASDMPMSPQDLAKFSPGQFPLVIGGVTPVVNIDGVKPGQLKFTGPEWGQTKDFYLVITGADGDQSYPTTATTLIVMYKKPKDAARTKAALDFFKWALEQGQPQAEELDYVPLLASLVAQIERTGGRMSARECN